MNRDRCHIYVVLIEIPIHKFFSLKEDWTYVLL